jgi:hypothetical protein
MLGVGEEAVRLQRFAPRAEFLREDVAARAERQFDEFWWPDNPSTARMPPPGPSGSHADSRCLAPSRPGTFCKLRSRLQRL